MSRETKLGLLVGTGIVLLIGIIISDYLATSKTSHKPADLTSAAGAPGMDASNSLVIGGSPGTNPSLNLYPPAPQQSVSTLPLTGSLDASRGLGIGASTPALNSAAPITGPGSNSLPTGPSQMALFDPPPMIPTRPAVNTQPGTIGRPTTPGANGNTSIGGAAASAAGGGGSSYTVKPGDNLWIIAKQFYGDGNQWKSIAEANKSSVGADGKNLKVGMKLTIPHVSTAAANKPASVPNISSASSGNTYKVVPGDNLYKISQKLLGNGNRWDEIVAANKGKISDPKDLKAGMVLTIPVTTPKAAPAPARNPATSRITNAASPA